MQKVLSLTKFLVRMKYLKEKHVECFNKIQHKLKHLVFKWILEIYYIYFYLIGYWPEFGRQILCVER
jgi:NADPH-dependent 7-cyano-7-deazaguanine reductase QueF